MKRMLDILLALILLVVSLPLMAVAVVGIKLTTNGPLFYGARRVGKDGREFLMRKFRTMHLGVGPAITRPGDSRIFPFGRFLRASKIDELPQLLNILAGDMSFVGPRPEDPRIVREAYEEWMMETLDVRPGLTSPGTVHFMHQFQSHAEIEDFQRHYIETILPEKLRLDLEYVRHGGVVDDILLILHTGWLVLRKMITLSDKE